MSEDIKTLPPRLQARNILLDLKEKYHEAEDPQMEEAAGKAANNRDLVGKLAEILDGKEITPHQLSQLEKTLEVFSDAGGEALGGRKSTSFEALERRYADLGKKLENANNQGSPFADIIKIQKESVAKELYEKYKSYWNQANPGAYRGKWRDHSGSGEKKIAYRPASFEEALALRDKLGDKVEANRDHQPNVVDVKDRGEIWLGPLPVKDPLKDVVADAGVQADVAKAGKTFQDRMFPAAPARTENAAGAEKGDKKVKNLNDNAIVDRIAGTLGKDLEAQKAQREEENRPRKETLKAKEAIEFFQKKYNESAAGHLAGQVRGARDIRGARGAEGVRDYLGSPENQSVIKALEADPKNNKPRPNEEAAARHWFWNQKTGRPGSLSFNLFDKAHEGLYKKLLGEREEAQRALKMPTDADKKTLHDFLEANKITADWHRNPAAKLQEFRDNIMNFLWLHQNSPSYNHFVETLNMHYQQAVKLTEPFDERQQRRANNGPIWPPGTEPNAEQQPEMKFLVEMHNHLNSTANIDEKKQTLEVFLNSENFDAYHKFAQGNAKAGLYWDNIHKWIQDNVSKLEDLHALIEGRFPDIKTAP